MGACIHIEDNTTKNKKHLISIFYLLLREVNGVRVKGLKWLSLIFLIVFSTVLVNVTYAGGAAKLYVDPELITTNPGGVFVINIAIADVLDMYAWGLKLSWDPHTLTVTDVVEGPFLQPGGDTFFASVVDNVWGTLDVGCTLLGVPWVPPEEGGAYPQSGSGILMTVTFAVEEAGKCALHLYDTAVIHWQLTPIKHTVADGYYEGPTANLVRRSAWPEHHHFVWAKDEDGIQNLTGKVKNLGDMDLWVKVVFEIVRDDGVVPDVESDAIQVAPGAIVELTAMFGPLDSLDVGSYYVSAKCEYSYYGVEYGRGEKIKTFSFAVK